MAMKILLAEPRSLDGRSGLRATCIFKCSSGCNARRLTVKACLSEFQFFLVQVLESEAIKKKTGQGHVVCTKLHQRLKRVWLQGYILCAALTPHS